MPAGSLTLWRWHSRSCPHQKKGRSWTRCKCAIWAQGSLGGEWIKRSLNTRDWATAAATVHGWEASGQIGTIKPELPTVRVAVEKFLDEAAVRNLKATTIKKRRELLEGKLLPYCKSKGYRHLKDLTVERLRDFRRGWPYSPLSSAKRLEYLRAFLRSCVEAGWLEQNPAAALKATKVVHRPTLPFADDEVERLIKAAQVMVDFGRYGPRIEPMILLLRNSGLRIQDAACLERSRLDGDKVFLYQQKTGTPVYCPLPEDVVKKLNTVENENKRYFFYDGTSQRESMVKSWDRVFKKVGERAEPPVANCHPHRFRDSFAVSLLLKGVSLDSVSKLLGHSSIKVTERHYSPWVKARQEQLEAEVRRIWA
ncbi:MAG: tyrosine-type recombinase/integrase [Vicinamibacterales bacterium]|nr:tyrosine-type recombinase/integrase [Vicinamibacterales bacterium]